MLFKRGIFLILVLGCSGLVKGQILDDSTRLAYGPRSTKFITEDDLRFNSIEYQIIDTTLFSSYRKNKVEFYRHYYQNLGLEGTALRSIYYELPQNIGVSPGSNSFSYYYREPSDLRYYDTRSPYSRMTIFLGGGNRSIADVEFSRNDSINVNFGFDFKNYSIDKQIERQGRGDKRVTGTQYDVYTHIRSSNLRYQLLANFTRNRQIVDESGGIDTTGIGDFFDNDVTTFLNGVTSDELRQGLHFYHQYSIKDFLEVYNSFGTFRQRNQYLDPNLSVNAQYYDQFFYSEVETLDSTDFRHSQVEVGLKGSIEDFYYNGFVKRREYDFINKYADSIPPPFDGRILERSGIERYYGFHAGYRFSKQTELFGGLEVLEGGLYEGYARFSGKNYHVEYRRGKYKPSFLQETYFGNHRLWTNRFRPVFADSFDGEYSFDFGNIVVTPTLGVDQVTDYIYFAEDTLPTQFPGNVVIINPGLKFKFDFLKHFTFEGNVIYTMLSDSVMAIPEILATSRLYYQNRFFGGNLESFIGIGVHYKSAYFGNAYDPVVQQYYLQTHTLVEGVPIADLFLNFKIKRANLFLRMNNLTQMITGEGYLVAPLYRGLLPTTDFGVTLWFFD